MPKKPEDETNPAHSTGERIPGWCVLSSFGGCLAWMMLLVDAKFDRLSLAFTIVPFLALPAVIGFCCAMVSPLLLIRTFATSNAETPGRVDILKLASLVAIGSVPLGYLVLIFELTNFRY